MKHTRYIYFLLLTVFFVGCDKREMQPYNSSQYVQFTSSSADTVLLSFLNYPGMNSVEVNVPVMMTGFQTSRDLKYKVTVDAKGSDAMAKSYTVAPDFTFKAGKQTDSVKIVFHNSSELQVKQYTLLIRLEGSSELLVGQTSYSYKYIKFSDRVVKPDWWNDIMDRFGLGVYTEKKYRLFITVTGVGDLSKFSDSRQLELMRIFKTYLGKQKDNGAPVLEEDGTDMLSTVPLK